MFMSTHLLMVDTKYWGIHLSITFLTELIISNYQFQYHPINYMYFMSLSKDHKQHLRPTSFSSHTLLELFHIDVRVPENAQNII